jgi:hypothetical protein
MQREAGTVPVVATGLSWLRQFWPHVGAGLITTGMAAFAGLGRGTFAYPDAPADLMEHGSLDQTKCCIACSRCTELMRVGSTPGCAIRDTPLYSGVHREAVAAWSVGYPDTMATPGTAARGHATVLMTNAEARRTDVSAGGGS